MHSRFRKGQSGNPGGRPGPRRAVDIRLEEEIAAALIRPPEILARSEPRSLFALLAKDLALSCQTDPAGIELIRALIRVPGRKRPRRKYMPAGMKRTLFVAHAAELVAQSGAQEFSR